MYEFENIIILRKTEREMLRTIYISPIVKFIASWTFESERLIYWPYRSAKPQKASF
jgi:hypothetical protein